MTTLLVAVACPGDPVAKARARRGKGLHWYTPQHVIDAESRIGWCVKTSLRGPGPDSSSLFAVDLKFRMKGAPRRDVDNLMKLVLDALNDIVWKDDSQVVDARGRIYHHDLEPRTEIRLGLVYQRSLIGPQTPPRPVHPPAARRQGARSAVGQTRQHLPPARGRD